MEKSNNRDTGRKAEQVALDYLLSKGHQEVAVNYQYGHLEIDLITRQGPFLVFTEVKARKQGSLSEPSSAVNKEKQKHIIKAAQHFMSSRAEDAECRFDIVAVSMRGQHFEIEHIEDAFRAFMR